MSIVVPQSKSSPIFRSFVIAGCTVLLSVAVCIAPAADNEAAASAITKGQSGAALIEAQYRSYLEGRDFRSYQQERGFVGERRFDSLGGREMGEDDPRPDPDRPTRLQRRFYGSSDSRCAGWSGRCDQRWGSGNPDYYGCMRYHGCR